MPTAVAAAAAKPAKSAPRWTTDQVEALFALPFGDLMFRAQQVHREHHAPNAIQRSTLLSVKTGGCSEDCKYCSQSARHEAKLERESLLELDQVIEAAKAAKARGATRFCMGAAWRGPKDRDLDHVLDMIRSVKGLGLETCVTLGLLKDGQAEKLKDAGLLVRKLVRVTQFTSVISTIPIVKYQSFFENASTFA
jgi:biotin synthase